MTNSTHWGTLLFDLVALAIMAIPALRFRAVDDEVPRGNRFLTNVK